jgi:hypothetical protein
MGLDPLHSLVNDVNIACSGFMTDAGINIAYSWLIAEAGLLINK